jgi:hypothetical protein
MFPISMKEKHKDDIQLEIEHHAKVEFIHPSGESDMCYFHSVMFLQLRNLG